jgi:hypothetical protein
METNHLDEHRYNQSLKHRGVGLKDTRTISAIKAYLRPLHHIPQGKAQPQCSKKL